MLRIFYDFFLAPVALWGPRLVILTIKSPPTLGDFPLPSVIPPWIAMLNPSLILNPEAPSQHTALS